MKSKSVIHKKHVIMTVLFAIYISEYMISLICMDKASYSLEDSGELLHYLKMPALAIGILLFPLSQRLGKQIRTRRIIMMFSNILFIAGMSVLMLFTPGLILSVAACIVSLLSLGFLGGAVYYYYSMGLVGHPFIGRLAGAGGAVAFLIQMSVQYLIPADIAILILLITGFVFSAYLTIVSKERFEWMFDEPLEYAAKGDPSLPDYRIIVAGATGMFLLYMICGLTDTMIVSMNFAGDMSMYAWPRLFGAIGYLVGGFLADLGHRRWIMISALCMSILSIPLPFMLQEGHTITATCIYYIIAVSQIMFLNVFFWDLAPKTPHPQFTAGMSRIIGCLSAVFLTLFSKAPVLTDMVIEVVLCAAVVACITLGGYVPVIRSGNITGDTTSRVENSDNINKLDEFSQKHGLTPRERELLAPLLESDDEIQTIASDMNISPRTVYRHINSIYEKTGTETRYALMRYYYETKQ